MSSDGRLCLSRADGRVEALEVSVLLAVVEYDGCDEAATPDWFAAKSPPEFSDSAANESDVISPGRSSLVPRGPV